LNASEVEVRREGRQMLYKLNPQPVERARSSSTYSYIGIC
jgi:hypothetical protein